MGCVCCSLSTFVSIVLHALERITLCTVCAMLVCCVLFTVLTVLIMGIGIGFHYCEVQSSVEAMANAAKAASALDKDSRRAGGETQQNKVLRSVNTAVKRGFAHRLGRRDRADQLMPSNNNTINDLILGPVGGNVTATLKRRKRDLTNNNEANSTNDTAVLKNESLDYIQLITNDNLTYTAVITNDSLSYEYYDDDTKINSTNETIGTEAIPDVIVSNVSVHDAVLLRQNCSLLNFFTRFLQL